MNKQRIRDLLGQLREEVRNTDIDDELRDMMNDLDEGVAGVIENDADVNVVIDRAKALEANFATSHPTAERVVREVVDLLVRMGI